MKHTPIPPLLLLLLSLSVGGCGYGDADGPAADQVPVRVAEEADLRIGSVDGTGPDVFGRIAGLAVDDLDRIYVADMQAHEIRVFGADGRFLFTIGRQGGGPGEFTSPCCLAIAPDGRLWVRDNGNARYVAFEVGADGGTAVATARMHHSDVNRHVKTTFDDAGRLIDIGMRPDPATGEPRTTLFHIGEEGATTREVTAPVPPDPDALVHRVPVQTGETMGVRYFYQPFGPRHLIAHGPAGVHADAVSSTYEVRWYEADGSLLRTIVVPGAEGPALSPEQRARGDSLVAADARFAGTSMPFDTPRRHPPITALRFDEAGRLWVQRTVLPDEPREVDVYGRDGELVERIRFPAGLDLTYGVLRPDMLIGVMRDELQVDYVVRLRLR